MNAVMKEREHIINRMGLIELRQLAAQGGRLPAIAQLRLDSARELGTSKPPPERLQHLPQLRVSCSMEKV